MSESDRQRRARERPAPERGIRVLHVEDDESMRATVATLLEDERDNLSVCSEPSGRRGLDRLEEEDFDCVVSDYRMPEMDGIEFLEAVRRRHDDLPFIIYTGKGSEEVASEAISAGVSDYLQKRGGTEEFAVLVKQIENVVERDRAIKRFRAFLESAPDGIVIVDRDGDIRQVNSQALELFGYDRSELVGEKLETLVPERFRESHRESREAYFGAPETRPMGADLDLYALRADGTEIPVDISISPLEAGGGLEVMASVRDISTRKWHERQLRQERAVTESIFSALPDVVYLVDTDGYLVRWNHVLEEVTGYTASELEDCHLVDLLPDEDRADIAEKLETVLDGRDPLRFESAFETTRGSRVPYEFTGGVVREDDGTVVGITGTCRDISERRTLRTELEASLERVTDGFVSLDREWGVTYLNTQAEELLRYDRSNGLGGSIWEALPELESSPIGEALRDANASNEPREVETYLESLDAWFETRVFPSESGVSVYLRDVTDRQERERRFEAIFENIYQFTGLMDPDGTMLEANRTALEFGGLERADVTGAPIWETYWFQVDEETPQRIRTDVERAAAGEFVRHEVTVQGRDEQAVIDFSIKPITDETGEVSLLVPEGRNITALKEKERVLQRQNKRLDEFASVVSHDLRNPLTVANLNLELARRERDDEYLDTIDEALDRMNDLIDSLLTMARKGMVVSETERVSLEAVATDAWRTVATESATLDVEADVQLDADRDRLRELFENLYRNAVEHAGPRSHIRVGSLQDGFFVEDCGPGIPSADREEVFEPGYTTSAEGNGYGLTIVRNIVDAHDWHVRTTDGTDGGARFEITVSNEYAAR